MRKVLLSFGAAAGTSVSLVLLIVALIITFGDDNFHTGFNFLIASFIASQLADIFQWILSRLEAKSEPIQG